jgi:hypothetical protein
MRAVFTRPSGCAGTYKDEPIVLLVTTDDFIFKAFGDMTADLLKRARCCEPRPPPPREQPC